MEAGRWAQIQQLFDAAIAMELQGRAAYLDTACEGDADLRREVESLLKAHSESGDFLERTERYRECKPNSSFEPGARVHQYEILSLLGAGGMGEVYLARDTRLQRRVALKLLPRGPSFSQKQLLRFEQEARTASALSHPNVCVIHEINQTETGDHYIAMEYVEGVTLRDRLRRGSLGIDEALEITSQVASALASAHKANIVHRDIKPENIMLRDDGQVKLLDFGVAKLYVAGATTAEFSALHTQQGMVVGTIKYMSPEQARGGAVDGRSDLWSLGVVLYEMLTGITPFAAGTQTDVLVAILTREPPPLARILPTVPGNLEQVVTRLLSKEPDGRYPTAVELIQDLKQMLQQPALSSARREKDVRGTRWKRWAVAVVVAALVGSAGWVGIRSWEAKRSSTSATEDQRRRVVALLPFENLSHDPEQEYFSEGMSEEISGQLSKLASLQLISRSAVARHKSALSNLRQIGQELGAGSLITGAVRQDHGRVRVNVELVDPQTERTLWSEQYDRELKDIFAVQSEIALRIAGALGAKLSAEKQEQIEKRPTDNVEAYQLYLRSHALAMGVRKDNLEAIDLLQKALAMDPRFGVALAYLSYRQQNQAFLGDPAYLDLGMENARKALALDPNLPDAHFSLASAYWFRGQLSKARGSFLKTLDLDPNFVPAMNNYSLEELDSGRADEALYWAARSFRLVPNLSNSYYHLTYPLIALGDDRTTERWLHEGEQRYPDATRLQYVHSIFDFVYRGKRKEALQRIRQALSGDPENEELAGVLLDLSLIAGEPDAADQLSRPFRLAPDGAGPVLVESNRLKYAYILQRQGDTANANRLAEEDEQNALKLMQEGDESYVLRVETAASWSLRNNPQKALEWLEVAYTAGARDYHVLESDLFFAKLHNEVRFREIVHRMTMDVAQMRKHAQEQLPEIFSRSGPGRAPESGLQSDSGAP